ncbi:hypothetical protein [Chryseobacterium wanjuense]
MSERKQGDFLSELLDKKEQNNLDEDIKKGEFYSIRYHIQDKFTNINTTSKNDPEETQRLSITSEKQSIEIGDYQYLMSFSRYDREPKKLNEDQFEFIDELTDKSSLKLILNETDEIDFDPQVMKLFEDHKNEKNIVKVPEIAMESDLGKYHVKLVFQQVTKKKYPYNKRSNIYYQEAYVLIKLK